MFLFVCLFKDNPMCKHWHAHAGHAGSGGVWCIILSLLAQFPLLVFLTFATTESQNNLNLTRPYQRTDFTRSNFMLQHCCWSSCDSSCSLWPAATKALWEQLLGLTPCFGAIAPGSPVPLGRYYCQTYWQTCCFSRWSMADLPLHRCRYLVHNALEKESKTLIWYIRH